MTKPGTHQVLNRLLTILYRSLPMYLTFARPWTHGGEGEALATIKRIAGEQEEMARRVAEYSLDQHGPLDIGEYPIEFLDMHDLSLDYLITRMVEFQRQDVSAIEACVSELKGDRQAGSLAEEALGAARAQLESLEERAEQLA